MVRNVPLSCHRNKSYNFIFSQVKPLTLHLKPVRKQKLLSCGSHFRDCKGATEDTTAVLILTETTVHAEVHLINTDENSQLEELFIFDLVNILT